MNNKKRPHLVSVKTILIILAVSCFSLYALFPHTLFFEDDSLSQDYTFEKNHIKNNFTEPIFSFVPAVGISEIINVPETFSKYWYNNFLITSLNGNSIYRVKFDDGFNKILILEKIFIGERIRDIKFNKKLNSFVYQLF